MRTLFFSLLLAGVIWLGWHWFHQPEDTRQAFSANPKKLISLAVNQSCLGTMTTERATVGELLRSLNLPVGEGDTVFPIPDTLLVSGMHILFNQARPVIIMVDGKKNTFHTTAFTAQAILDEQHITLDEDDIVTPAREIVVARDATINVIRVEIREETKDAKIDFTTKTNEDDSLSWRIKKVTQKGESGIKRTTYRVSYHDGKEVNRKVTKTETVKEPVTEVVTQGTLVKVGKSHRGAASWYAFTGTLSAANPWLPIGSFVRVTNFDNGKSVIVRINDRGPFVPGRIIDLDKVAFAKIASIGAGVINVKMEEITN